MKRIVVIAFIACISSMAFSQSTAKKAKIKKSPPIDLNRFVLVEGGTYTMGSDKGIEPHEKPEHQVKVDDFYVAKYETTFDDYDRFCDSTKKPHVGDMNWGRGKRPMMIVSWQDATEYCNWLSRQEKLQPCYLIKDKDITWLDTANGYRLPTEAEWEYAARGGAKSNKTIYAGSDKPDNAVWYNVNSDNKTQPVGQKAPNELDLYDMNGNVWEWVWDVYDGAYYQKSPTDNPKGPESGMYRTMRGGAWYNNVNYITVSSRQYHTPDFRQNSVGFRIARNK